MENKRFKYLKQFVTIIAVLLAVVFLLLNYQYLQGKKKPSPAPTPKAKVTPVPTPTKGFQFTPQVVPVAPTSAPVVGQPIIIENHPAGGSGGNSNTIVPTPATQPTQTPQNPQPTPIIEVCLPILGCTGR